MTMFSEDQLKVTQTAFKMGYEFAKEDRTSELEYLKARVAILEKALRDVIPYVDTCNSEHRKAQQHAKSVLGESK